LKSDHGKHHPKVVNISIGVISSWIPTYRLPFHAAEVMFCQTFYHLLWFSLTLHQFSVSVKALNTILNEHISWIGQDILIPVGLRTPTQENMD
jgi:hypothetical protein